MANRYADPVTMDHIIELKKQLAEAERQRDNALSMVWKLRMDVLKFHGALTAIVDIDYRGNSHPSANIARAALKEGE